MDIHQDLVPILRKVKFADRYKLMCESHSDFDNSLNNYNREIIKESLEDKGINVSFIKGEKFYKVKESIGSFSIQFNIIPKAGFLQFVWDVKRGNERLELGWGMWESITRELTEEQVTKPLFSTEEELQEILVEAISIYEDFKNALKETFV